jgi:putative effector of murein hydrolase LrgA (UPF0299 family)
MLYAVTALLVCQLIGECIVQSTGLPLPGPLVGMMLLFIGLVFHGRVPAVLDQTSGKLFRHMMLFFTPIVVGVMMHVDHVAAEWLPFLVACLVGSAVTLVVTALSLQWMLKRRRAAGQ